MILQVLIIINDVEKNKSRQSRDREHGNLKYCSQLHSYQEVMFKPSIERGKKSSLAERYLEDRALQAERKECTYAKVDAWRRNMKSTSLTSGHCQGNIVGNGICCPGHPKVALLHCLKFLSSLCDGPQIKSLFFAWPRHHVHIFWRNLSCCCSCLRTSFLWYDVLFHSP